MSGKGAPELPAASAQLTADGGDKPALTVQALEPGEIIEPRVVAWSDALAMCRDGRIEDAKTVAALLLTAQRRRPSLLG